MKKHGLAILLPVETPDRLLALQQLRYHPA